MKKKVITLLVIGTLLASITAPAASANKQKITADAATQQVSCSAIPSEAGSLGSSPADYLSSNAAALGLPGDADFQLLKSVQDDYGQRHYLFQQQSQGLPVYGKYVVLDAAGNTPLALRGSVLKSSAAVIGKRSSDLDESAAISAAIQSAGIERSSLQLEDSKGNITITPKESASLILYPQGNAYAPAWQVDIYTPAPRLVSRTYFVDAASGSILRELDNIRNYSPLTASGSGVWGNTVSIAASSNPAAEMEDGKWQLRDISRGDLSGNSSTIRVYDMNSHDDMFIALMRDDDGVLDGKYVPVEYAGPEAAKAYNQRAGVDAMYNLGLTYDYLQDELNRNSYDGKGANVNAQVHYPDDFAGGPMDNAFFDPTSGIFGFGDGENYAGLQTAGQRVEFTVGLDVIAHELFHGVTENNGLGGLIYADQSGAINESLSDLFGELIERHYEPDNNLWLMGEDLAANKQGAFRSMKDPTIYGDPADYKDYLYTENDNGGVHTNSGIPNKAAYLICQRLGDEQTAQLYYYTVTNLVTPSCNFFELRDALIQASTILYPDSNTAAIVSEAFAAVGITDENYVPTSSIKLSEKKLTIGTGSGTVLEAEVLPADAVDKSLTWKISNPSMAAISYEVTSSNFVVIEALAPGKVQLTASLKNGLSATCNITIKTYQVKKIKLSERSLTMLPGEGRYLEAIISPDNASTAVTWTSENPAVAEVDEFGIVTAIAPGKTKIIATSVSTPDKSAFCKVTVKEQ